jgi:hypothetical protein
MEMVSTPPNLGVDNQMINDILVAGTQEESVGMPAESLWQDWSKNLHWTMKVKQCVVVKTKSKILLTHFLLIFYWFPSANKKQNKVRMMIYFSLHLNHPKHPPEGQPLMKNCSMVHVQKN